MVADLFASRKPIIIVVHLLPLPGSPRWGGSMEAVVERALTDARVAAAGGADAVILENYGDLPFRKDHVDHVTVGAMALVAHEVRGACGLPMGINVLRNDAHSAVSIASVVGADFIRVNVHTGACVTDQGIIEGKADETLRLRDELMADLRIFADVLVKHAAVLAPVSLETAARDTAYRGLADALIITGRETRLATEVKELQAVKRAVPDRPVLAGSGVSTENVGDILVACDGIIVGSSLKVEGQTENPVDPLQVTRFVTEADKYR